MGRFLSSLGFPRVTWWEAERPAKSLREALAKRAVLEEVEALGGMGKF
jgi:glucose-6-phosphate dehydrogenase assembly protein OpcA